MGTDICSLGLGNPQSDLWGLQLGQGQLPGSSLGECIVAIPIPALPAALMFAGQGAGRDLAGPSEQGPHVNLYRPTMEEIGKCRD